MVKVKPSVTVYLEKSGQKITLDLSEAKELIKSLTVFVRNDQAFANKRTKAKAVKSSPRHRRSTYRLPTMSETKKQEVLSYVNKQLSTKPRTLSNLLKGTSYLPNHLPLIRKMVEDQSNVSKQVIGKRTYYRHKGSKSHSEKVEKGTTASAA